MLPVGRKPFAIHRPRLGNWYNTMTKGALQAAAHKYKFASVARLKARGTPKFLRLECYARKRFKFESRIFK